MVGAAAALERSPASTTAARVIAAALCGALAGTIPSMIVASSLNEIAATFGTSIRALSWAITAPLMACAVALPALGRLSDLFGHRRLFLGGVTAAAVLSVATAAAPGPELFVAGRVLTQVAATAAQPSAVAMLRAAVPPGQRAAVFSAWGFTMSAGPAIGLVIGGLLIDGIGWPATFLMQAAVAALAAVLALRMPAIPIRRVGERFDAWGAAWLGVIAFATLVVLDRGFGHGWLEPVTLGVMGGAVTAGAVLIAVERRQPFPIVPRHLRTSRVFRGAVGAQFCMQGLVLGSIALVPLLLRDVLGYSASAASLVVVFVPAGFGVASPLGGRFASRHPRLLVVIGAATMSAAMVLLSAGCARQSPTVVAAALLLLGAGGGIGRTVYVLVVTNAGGHGHVGIATGLERLCGQVGGSFGVAVLVGLATSRGGTPGAIATAAGAGTALGLAALAIAVRAPGIDPAGVGDADDEASLAYGQPSV